ncbi:hypothetical protein FB459_1991 [Yimella lutea]|uniref:Uncharacterized protein n=1 Tax=Yimella lutea TaxID=587872 RepID=A0A542EGU0_9MICO|nr:hypothetical protein [Yimella lutea]TQJ14524.1 hypothetical protein FB459_1991 [Yimella lutea]
MSVQSTNTDVEAAIDAARELAQQSVSQMGAGMELARASAIRMMVRSGLSRRDAREHWTAAVADTVLLNAATARGDELGVARIRRQAREARMTALRESPDPA